MLAVTLRLPVIAAEPEYGKASTPVNPLPSPTNAVEVVVPVTFKLPTISVWPEKYAGP